MRAASISLILSLGLVSAAALLSSCGGDPEPAPFQQTGTKRVDPSTTGAVAGRATFAGQAPAPAPIRTSGDATCAKDGNTIVDESLVVGADGGLKNAFVYVKSGLDDYAFDPPSGPVVLDQQGCRYVPHVFGVRAGQPIEIRNSDPTLHNVHAVPERNREFNKGMPLPGMTLRETFTVPEIGVPFTCDVHSWMTSYANIVSHPYFAVTDDTGRFTLPDLPPGTYTLEMWHEKLGTRTQSVTIAASQQADVTFTFGN